MPDEIRRARLDVTQGMVICACEWRAHPVALEAAQEIERLRAALKALDERLIALPARLGARYDSRRPTFTRSRQQRGRS